MKKSFILKGLTAMILLSSVGIAESAVNLTHNVAHAEKNVIEIKDGHGVPYNSVVAFNGATGFVVGPNTIVTNKHVTKHLKVGERVNAHPSSFGNSGGRYNITEIVDYSGTEDIAVVHVGSIGEEGWDFNRFTRPMPLASEGHVGERVTLIGYPMPSKNMYKLYASLGTVVRIDGSKVIYDAFAEPGNSGGPIMNESGQAIGVHFASDTTTLPSKKSYGVYFTENIKNFINQQIEKHQ
ncbi:TPA: serine protease [Staphylococcus delphini]|uniref:trypsin-like serine peptidase n=1 Tax=Staphylococcus delphini TaxID=53344 RepID=UPI0023B3025C|nr:serine protease [Staphylococcus delphini]MDE9828993.1 serine protease [Staphylococcus delphini]HEC2173569.1 serine protease [Staphylococcus delphini]